MRTRGRTGRRRRPKYAGPGRRRQSGGQPSPSGDAHRDAESDAAALRSAAGGGAHFAFDMVGRAQNAHATLAGLKSLRRWGRLVLMGSMTVPLPLTYAEVMLNNLEIIGNFMYPANVFLKLLGLVRSGLLDLGAIQIQKFGLADLPAAMDAAEKAGGLSCTMVNTT